MCIFVCVSVWLFSVGLVLVVLFQLASRSAQWGSEDIIQQQCYNFEPNPAGPLSPATGGQMHLFLLLFKYINIPWHQLPQSLNALLHLRLLPRKITFSYFSASWCPDSTLCCLGMSLSICRWNHPSHPRTWWREARLFWTQFPLDYQNVSCNQKRRILKY